MDIKLPGVGYACTRTQTLDVGFRTERIKIYKHQYQCKVLGKHVED